MTEFYWIPLLIMAISVPMILGKIPPNRVYGFRTSSTLASPAVWYPANRVAGWFLFAGAGCSLCFNLALWWISPDWPPGRVESWMEFGIGIPVVVAVVASVIYLRRL